MAACRQNLNKASEGAQLHHHGQTKGMISFATGLCRSTRFVDKSALLSNKVHFKIAIPIKVQRTGSSITALLQKLWKGGSKLHTCSVLNSKAQYASLESNIFVLD